MCGLLPTETSNPDPGSLLLRACRFSLMGHVGSGILATSTRKHLSDLGVESLSGGGIGSLRDTPTQRVPGPQDGRIVALLPLYLWRRYPFRIVRFLGHHGGISSAQSVSLIIARRSRRALARALSDQADVFVGERLPREEGWSASAFS